MAGAVSLNFCPVVTVALMSNGVQSHRRTFHRTGQWRSTVPPGCSLTGHECWACSKALLALLHSLWEQLWISTDRWWLFKLVLLESGASGPYILGALAHFSLRWEYFFSPSAFESPPSLGVQAVYGGGPCRHPLHNELSLLPYFACTLGKGAVEMVSLPRQRATCMICGGKN